MCVTQKTAERPCYLLSSPTLANIDHESRGLETVIASSSGRLYVLDSTTGHPLDNYPLTLPAAVHTQVTSVLVTLSNDHCPLPM